MLPLRRHAPLGRGPARRRRVRRSGVVLTAFAGWLLYLSPRQRATRALAALLVSIGLVWFEDVASNLLPLSFAPALLRFSPIALTSVGLSAVYFLSVYPRPRGWLGRSRWGGAAVVGVGAAFAAAFIARLELFAGGVLQDRDLKVLALGPLFAVTAA